MLVLIGIYLGQRVGDHRFLKTDHEYYAQVQGHMASAAWCDYVVYTFKGVSIQRIPFDQEFWDNISQTQVVVFPTFSSLCYTRIQSPG